jgi:hypothetical protein
MSALAIAGAAGIGLAWGWMLGWPAAGRHPVRNAVAAAAASVLVAGSALLYAGWSGAAAFGGAAALALLLHLGQRRVWAEARS